jgi:hypothetical protein
MRVASIVYLDFLDAHNGYYMATAYIHLHSFFAIQFSIHENFISASLVHCIYMCACISF